MILPLFLTVAPYRSHPIFCLLSVITIIGNIKGGFAPMPQHINSKHVWASPQMTSVLKQHPVKSDCRIRKSMTKQN
tara:strand:+ start:1058 stop:1285 length:228 start_codon:yes stop_codon:yes gene_type:complete